MWNLLGAAILPPALGFIADLLLGDPPAFPHPVRLFGTASVYLEKILRPHLRGPGGEILGGILLTGLVAGGALTAVMLVVRAGFTAGYPWGVLTAACFMYSCLAIKDMLRHVQRVDFALTQYDLVAARRQVSLLVSRDTTGLGPAEIARAALESLFENQADGVTAPLFFGALGGAPWAMFYKAVNTLDSMVGYKTPRYRHWGFAAARLDDLLNYFPARLSAFCLLLAGFTLGCPRQQALQVFRRDRRKHDSPNSGWPEAAGAAVLNIRLGGSDQREGLTVIKPLINPEGKIPGAADLKRGMRLFWRASLLSLFLNLALAGLWSFFFVHLFPEVFS